MPDAMKRMIFLKSGLNTQTLINTIITLRLKNKIRVRVGLDLTSVHTKRDFRGNSAGRRGSDAGIVTDESPRNLPERPFVRTERKL